MTVDEIKTDLFNHIGKSATIKYNLGRNKIEKYHVKIKNVYNFVFLVELKNDTNEVKSFSYSDVITNTIKIEY